MVTLESLTSESFRAHARGIQMHQSQSQRANVIYCQVIVCSFNNLMRGLHCNKFFKF